MNFTGALFTAHECPLTENSDKTHPIKKQTFEELRKIDEAKETYLREEVKVEVEVMRECEWLKLKKTPEIKAFLEDNKFGLIPVLNQSQLKRIF